MCRSPSFWSSSNVHSTHKSTFMAMFCTKFQMEHNPRVYLSMIARLEIWTSYGWFYRTVSFFENRRKFPVTSCEIYSLMKPNNSFLFCVLASNFFHSLFGNGKEPSGQVEFLEQILSEFVFVPSDNLHDKYPNKHQYM